MKFQARVCVPGKDELDLSLLYISSCWRVWPTLTSRGGCIFQVHVHYADIHTQI